MNYQLSIFTIMHPIFFLFLVLCFPKLVFPFTCQGSTYSVAVSACPDQDAQLMSMGGNLTINVLYATNVPDKDSTLPSSKLDNPYIRFTVGSISGRTESVLSSSTPFWNQPVNLGFLGSGTIITVELWNAYSGVLFTDKLIATSFFNVPFCSYFHANESTVPECEVDPFNCKADDSAWQMPTRKVCQEQGAINFKGDTTCEEGGMCVFIETTMIPFQMSLEVTYADALASTPVLSVAGKPTAQALWTFDNYFGYPFIGSTDYIDTTQVEFMYLKGSLMWRMRNSEKSYGAEGAIKFYTGLNFPATIYICRFEGDDSNGIPSWITSEYSSFYSSSRQIILYGSGDTFDCFSNDFPATSKNQWGGVEANPVAFKTNTLPGLDSNTPAEQADYSYMYIILAVPNVAAPRGETLVLTYDAQQFLGFFGSYGLICLWFIFLVFKFLQKIDYRVDRLSSYFVTRVITGKDRNLLATLLMNKNQSPCNIEFRAHLFHGMLAMYLCFSLPFFLLIGWGMSCAMVVRPRALGVGVTFIGWAALLGYFGYRYWQKSSWRLSTISLTAVSLAIFFFMIFLLVSLFVEPGVLQLGQHINFVGLSLIFATLNCVPCLLLIFKNDRSHQVFMSLVVAKISEAVHLLKQKSPAVSITGKERDTKINRILHALLGETYSINPKIPSFQYSTVIHEPSESYHSSVQSNSERVDPKVSGDEPGENLDLLTEERKLYGIALFILFLYLMFAIGSTLSPSLAFLNICSLILLDGIHLSLSKGNIDWSPGFKVLLLVLGRLLICGSPQSLWILNYSACYAVYSITLINEMINSYLPKLSRRKAGEIVFGGGDYQETVKESLKTDDLSGGPAFCLSFLSLCFIAVLIVSGFMPKAGTDESALAVPSLSVLGLKNWRIYYFGIIAFLVTAVSGLTMATVRAFELEHHGLLRGWARETYLFRRQVKLPLVLAISTEFSILLSGLLIYALTKANAVLVGCIFLPAIFFCLGFCLRIWVKNDYELVKWPRPKGEDTSSFWATASASTVNSMQAMSSSVKKSFVKGNKDVDGGDLEVAFNMMENLTQAPSDALVAVDFEDEIPESQSDPSSPEKKEGGEVDGGDRILKGFTLPPLKAPAGKENAVKEIKMPPLPLKSVLRRKRQNLTTKFSNNDITNTASSLSNANTGPLIADLRGRENAKEKDQFGNKNDVIDLSDPWAQFELNEDEGLISGKTNRELKSSKLAKRGKKKSSTSWIRTTRLFFKKNKYLQYLYQWMGQAYSYLQTNSKIHPSKYQVKFDEDNEKEEGVKEAKDGNGEDENDDDDEENNKASVLPMKEDEDDSENEGEQEDSLGRLSRALSVKPKEESKGITASTSVPTLPDEDYELDETEIAKLNFWDAFAKGYLNAKESMILYTWFLALLLIMLFGISLSAVCAPLILGFIVWISLWLLLFFGIPIYKYFQIYQFDETSILMMRTGIFVHILFSLTFLFASLESSKYTVIDSIWVLDFLIYFPVFLYIIFHTIKWIDSGFKLALIDSNDDGQISFSEALKFLQTFPAIMVMLILLNWQLYLWINEIVGLLFTLSMIIAGIAYLFIKDWVRNDYFLSPEFRMVGKITVDLTIFLSFMTAIFQDSNPTFPLSVFIFAIGFKYVMKIITRLSVLEKGTLFYFSPYIMPVYSYHTLNQDINDESELAKDCSVLLLLGVLWGAILTIFFSPTNIGVTIACSFLLKIASTGALCSSYIPRELAKSNSLLTPDSIIETANYAKEKFLERREPLNLEMKDFQMEVPDEIIEDDQEKLEANKTLRQKLMERTSFENALSIIADIRSLKYVKEDRTAITEAREAMEEDEYELPWYQQIFIDAIKASKDFMRNVYELLPINHNRGWKKHSQAPFTIKDMAVEVFLTGRGPFGLFGVEGQIFKLLKSFKGMGQFEKLYPRWTEQFDAHGNDKRLVQLSDYIDYVGILTRVNELDKALDFTYREETRCAIHFLLMLLISADSKLQREQVLFQKFLRENRFRLASNGITPPKDIFSSTSFASINIPLVAIWLSTLSKDEQDRFHLLKDSFNIEQKERDELIDQSDYEELMKAQDVKKQRLFHHMNYMQHIFLEIKNIRANKIQQFQDSLFGPDRNKFLQRKELWINDLNCFVELKDTELYERFRSQCLNVVDEYSIYSQNFIYDCETAQRDIHTGEYGRNYQFVDSEFPPNETSLGDDDSTSLVLGWRCAPGIVENIDVFEGGTHLDDICEGVYKDTWLLSAISMIVAASKVGNGYINEQIRRIFITHPSLKDGEHTYETEVGVYGIQIYRNSEWIPILIDDLLPMRRKEQWTNENRGMASAHLKECKGLWLPLIEKAFAKYYGSYSALTTGYVHHALEDLTGCEAECIPLSVYSRGINKSNLWDRLLKYKRNGYILGAGTGSAEFIDKELLDMGINFNSSYTIYDIIQVDHHQLLKLRNPPGNNQQTWKGDWSANSALWSKRLKHKCDYYIPDEDTPTISQDPTQDSTRQYQDKNTFLMSFDDFLNVFRFLYVCKYYNPNKWHEIKLNGIWKQSNEAVIEQMELMHQFFSEAAKDEENNNLTDDAGAGGEGKKFENNEELMNKKKVYAQLNSSGGLPTKHNPNCQVENNPYYSLTIYRPTDLKISVTQYEGKYQQAINTPNPRKGAAANSKQLENVTIPFAIFIVKNPHGTIPHRLTAIHKDDISYSTGEAQFEKTLYLYANNILPGDYLVLVAPYLAGMEGKFRLSVVSNYRCECNPIWPPAWMLKDGDIFNINPIDEKFEDQMKRNFVRGSDAAKKNLQRVKELLRKGMRRLLGANNPFERDDDEEGNEDDEDEEEGGGNRQPAVETEMVPP